VNSGATYKIIFKLRYASGHDFSRAANDLILISALAASALQIAEKKDAGAKTQHLLADLPARLKSCPDASCNPFGILQVAPVIEIRGNPPFRDKTAEEWATQICRKNKIPRDWGSPLNPMIEIDMRPSAASRHIPRVLRNQMRKPRVLANYAMRRNIGLERDRAGNAGPAPPRQEPLA
jgi:hypothetical protein